MVRPSGRGATLRSARGSQRGGVSGPRRAIRPAPGLARAAGWGVLLGLVAFVGIVGGRRLWGEARRLASEQIIDPALCRAVGGPDWARSLAAPELALALAEVSPAGFYDPHLASACWDALRLSPWVQQVVWVRRSYPDRLRAAVLLRRPVAAVRGAGGSFAIVDGKGLRLPGSFDRVPRIGTRPLPVLVGTGKEACEPGETWRDRAVLEGAAVAVDLGRTGLLSLPGVEIRRIDLRNVGGRLFPEASEVLLETARGAVVAWGRSSLSPWATTEPGADRKAEMLREVLTRYPGLEGVRLIKVYLREPAVLPGDPRAAAADARTGG